MYRTRFTQRPVSMPGVIAMVIALALMMGAGLGVGVPEAWGGVPRQLHGRVIASSSALAMPGDGDNLLSHFNSIHRPQITRNPDGTWTVNFLAFFRGSASTARTFVVFYEEKDGESVVVEHFGFNVEPSQTSLMSSVRLGDNSFNPGRKYQMRVTRVDAQKREHILARTEVTLQ